MSIRTVNLRGRRGTLVFLFADGSERQADDKRRPFILAVAFRPNRSSVESHDLLHDGKP